MPVQTANISFAGSENKSASELGGAQPSVVNAVIDAVGAIHRRPGTVISSAMIGTGTAPGTVNPVIGMLPFKGLLVYVTADRRVHAVTPGVASRIELSTDDLLTQVAGSGRVSMIAGRNLLVMAGGAQIQKWDGVSSATARLTNTGVGGPPPASVFLCAIAQRLVAQVADSSGQIWWSAPLEQYEDWDMITDGAGFIQAAAKPDPLVAMLDNTNEVFAFGSETLQVFAPAAAAVDVNDPNNLLDFAPSRTLGIGTISPNSVFAYDDSFVLLDRNRRFVITDGRSYTDISRPVARLIRSARSITDVWGFRMRFDRLDCLVWFFPTDGFGLMYDVQTSAWSEWRQSSRAATGTEITGNVSLPMPITCAYNWAEKGLFLIGMVDGSVQELSADSPTDTTYGFGAPIDEPVLVSVVSGFIDHGTMSQKLCRTLLLKLQRTWADSADDPTGLTLSHSGHVRVSMRDNQGAWKIVKDVHLSSDPNPSIQIRSLGVYRTRQWKIEYDGADELQIVSAQEEFEVLGA